MRNTFIRLLGILFPVRKPRVENSEELREWLRYEASNYTHLDPYRPLGYRDSSARLCKANATRREANKGNTTGINRARISKGEHLDGDAISIAEYSQRT